MIEKEKPKENLLPDILFILPKFSAILENDDFEQKQEIKQQQDKEIKDEIDLTRLKDEIGSEETPDELEVYFGGSNQNFFKCVQALI